MNSCLRMFCLSILSITVSATSLVDGGSSLQAQHKTIVIAHRGACGYLPEHTLEAACMAFAMNADYIEQDVVLTRDNIPVVLHDIHLDSVTNVAQVFPDRGREDGRYFAIDFSLAEIKQLTVNERIDLKTGEAVFPGRYPVGKSAFQIPTLAEEIELIQGLNKSNQRNVGIYVEVKSPVWHRQQGKDISRIVLETMNRYGYSDKTHRAFVQCFDPVETRRMREELGCKLKLVQLIGDNDWDEAATDFDQLRTADGIRKIAEYADGIGPRMQHILEPVEGQVSPRQTELVKLAHAAGLVVHPFTFRADSLPDYANSFDEVLVFFCECGVDGLFTDFPDKACQKLAAMVKEQSLGKDKPAK